MPKPYEFLTEEELIQHLGCENTVTKFESFFSYRSPSIEDVIKSGVAGNTFRAFRNLPVKPSITFREWAMSYIKNTLHELSTISDIQHYTQFVHEATNNLCSEWQRTTGSEMGYGRGAKLFNLVLKRLACLSSLTKDQRSTLINLLHVPLDSYTIIGLRKIVPRFSIPNNATMKFIKTPAQYIEYQTTIRSIAYKAGVPPIYYDVLSWDMVH
jgi:hypothetical protein